MRSDAFLIISGSGGGVWMDKFEKNSFFLLQIKLPVKFSGSISFKKGTDASINVFGMSISKALEW